MQRIRFRGGEEPLEVPATEHPSPGRRVAREIEERLVAAQRRPERGETGAELGQEDEAEQRPCVAA